MLNTLPSSSGIDIWFRECSNGDRITSAFKVRRWLGDRGVSLLTSLNVSIVRGLEFLIVLVSVISVLRFSSFKLEPCVFSRALRIVQAEYILDSQMLPECKAADGFFCQLTQFVRLCCLICFWFILLKGFFDSFDAPTKLVPLSDHKWSKWST